MSAVKISSIPQFGDHGAHVLAYQKALKAKGFSPGALDGAFGGNTKAAGSKFQKSMGLKGTGIPGPQTIKLLNLEVSSAVAPAPSPTTKHELPSIKVKTPRNLLPALETMIDNQLWKSYRSKILAAIQAKDANAIMLLACEALEDLHIREKTNQNDGTIVELIQKISYGRKGDPWCMYAVMVAIAYAEKKLGVVSKLISTGSCAGLRQAKSSQALVVAAKDSQPGDIWIWLYPKGTGHTGIFKAWVKKLVEAYLFEGNTTKGIGADGKIDRDGGGYYLTERPYTIPGMTLKMVLRAFP